MRENVIIIKEKLAISPSLKYVKFLMDYVDFKLRYKSYMQLY